jgi:hypothetical protein
LNINVNVNHFPHAGEEGRFINGNGGSLGGNKHGIEIVTYPSDN